MMIVLMNIALALYNTAISFYDGTGIEQNYQSSLIILINLHLFVMKKNLLIILV